jgi:GNAT superfamily N-acetyltransferase
MAEEPEIWLLQDDELAEALALSTQAGWNQTLKDWENLLYHGFCLGGRLNGRLVCTGTLVDYQNGGWLGMLLVDQEFRKHGFGSRMLNVLLKAADEKLNFQWVGLDATELGHPMYLKCGFHDIGFINRWEISPRIFPELMETREFTDPIDVPDVEDLDVEAFGSPRAWKVFVDSEFLVCNEGERLVGFGRSRPGRLGYYIGPVVARSPQAATSIIAALTMNCYLTEDRLFIDVPAGNPIEKWLEDGGFKIIRSWTRMMRGTPKNQNAELIFGIAGPELG